MLKVSTYKLLCTCFHLLESSSAIVSSLSHRKQAADHSSVPFSEPKEIISNIKEWLSGHLAVSLINNPVHVYCLSD